MNTESLIKIIRKIVREEVKKIARPIINEILSEKYMKTLAENRTETVSVSEQTSSRASVASRPSKEELRKKMLEKLGVDEQGASLFYEGTDPGGSANGTSALKGSYVDDDDVGVDLSKFAR